MKYLIFAFLLVTASVSVNAQQQTPREVAYTYMRSGDFDNAILVLNRAIQQDVSNQQLLQDLALSYFYKKDFAKAKEQTKILLDRDDVNVISYQIAGNVYKALEEVKEADKMYKKALKKFPNSGPLYSEYGELYSAKNDNTTAIKIWEKGIELDPAYAGNYYNAASYYYFTKDKIWTIIYGEIFTNMEYLTDRATEMKKLLLAAYKEKLFEANSSDAGEKSPFAKAVLETYNKQSSLLSKGLSVETLSMIRTKFILDWYAKHGAKYPFKLFDYHQQLIREGMFDSYNYWLFGVVDNLPAFDQWTKTNTASYKKFTDFQKNRVFRMPAGQYYQNMK